jgi:hypothetical protein
VKRLVSNAQNKALIALGFCSFDSLKASCKLAKKYTTSYASLNLRQLGTRMQSVAVIKNPSKNWFNLFAIGRKPNAKIFFFSIRCNSNHEMAIATNIPIIYLVGFSYV